MAAGGLWPKGSPQPPPIVYRSLRGRTTGGGRRGRVPGLSDHGTRRSMVREANGAGDGEQGGAGSIREVSSVRGDVSTEPGSVHVITGIDHIRVSLAGEV